MTFTIKQTRRQFIATAAAGVIAAPHVARAQESALKITGWGGKWGQVFKDEIGPAFEKEFKCKLQTDTAFPFLPKLQASRTSDPIYDVLHTNSNEQWAAAEMGIIEPEVSARTIPNLKDMHAFAHGPKIAGVCMFTSAIGLGYRTDKGLPPITSWNDYFDRRYDGTRGGYLIPVNSFGQMFLMLCGKLYGKGFEDLDAAYKKMEELKPIKLVDFTGVMEKNLLSGECNMALMHDSGILRYDGENQPIAWAAPKEGVLALEQVLSVTPGSKKKELAYAFINHMLSAPVQKRLAETVWYSPANKTVVLDDKYKAKLLTTPEQVATLIQVDWKWYNARKDEIDSRVNKIFRA